MKKTKINMIVSMLIMIAVGIFLLIRPGDTLTTAVRIFGIALLVLGAVGVVSQLLQKDDRSVISLIISAVEAVVGIIIIASPAFVVSLFPIVVGVIVALYGLSDLITALNMKKADIGSWKLALILAVITIILGVILFANPFKTMSTLVRIIGVVLVYKGVTGLFIRLKA